MRRVPSKQELGSCLVEKQFRRADSCQSSWIIRHLLQIRNIVTIFLPTNQVIRYPEVYIGLIITAIANKVITAIGTFANAGMAVVFPEDALAAVEHLPMQTI